MEIYLLSLLDKLGTIFGIIAMLAFALYMISFVLNLLGDKTDPLNEKRHKMIKKFLIISIVATVLYLFMPNTKTINGIYGDDIYTESYETIDKVMKDSQKITNDLVEDAENIYE